MMKTQEQVQHQLDRLQQAAVYMEDGKELFVIGHLTALLWVLDGGLWSECSAKATNLWMDSREERRKGMGGR